MGFVSPIVGFLLGILAVWILSAKSRRRRALSLLLVTFVVMFITGLWFSAPIWIAGYGESLWQILGDGDTAAPRISSLGEFGDMFGVANALFSAFALLGVVLSLAYQRNELRAAHAEYKEQTMLMRRELAADIFFRVLSLHQEEAKPLIGEDPIREEFFPVSSRRRDDFAFFPLAANEIAEFYVDARFAGPSFQSNSAALQTYFRSFDRVARHCVASRGNDPSSSVSVLLATSINSGELSVVLARAIGATVSYLTEVRRCVEDLEKDPGSKWHTRVPKIMEPPGEEFVFTPQELNDVQHPYKNAYVTCWRMIHGGLPGHERPVRDIVRELGAAGYEAISRKLPDWANEHVRQDWINSAVVAVDRDGWESFDQGLPREGDLGTRGDDKITSVEIARYKQRAGYYYVLVSGKKLVEPSTINSEPHFVTDACATIGAARKEAESRFIDAEIRWRHAP